MCEYVTIHYSQLGQRWQKSRSSEFPGCGEEGSVFLPWRGAGQRLTSGTVGDIRCDYREDEPGGQEPPPVKFGSKVERNDPHLEQSHQLEDSRAAVLAEVRRQRDSYCIQCTSLTL